MRLFSFFCESLSTTTKILRKRIVAWLFMYVDTINQPTTHISREEEKALLMTHKV